MSFSVTGLNRWLLGAQYATRIEHLDGYYAYYRSTDTPLSDGPFRDQPLVLAGSPDAPMKCSELRAMIAPSRYLLPNIILDYANLMERGSFNVTPVSLLAELNKAFSGCVTMKRVQRAPTMKRVQRASTAKSRRCGEVEYAINGRCFFSVPMASPRRLKLSSACDAIATQADLPLMLAFIAEWRWIIRDIER